MGQDDVLKALKKINEPLSVGEIAVIIGCFPSEVSKDLNKLIQYKEVKFKEIDRIIAMSKYKCKRRMKIYYV